MEFFVDRELPVPLRTQLHGLIEYGIACGELTPGETLPSVRELAEKIGVAPMTVSQVYADLKAAGLIDAKPGSGTFVTDSLQSRLAGRADASGLHRHIDQLIDESRTLGIRPAELVSLVSARVFYRDSIGPRIRIVMIGLFPEATASYARFIAARLGRSVTVEPLTVSAIERDVNARARANSADLAVTFANRHREVAGLVPNTKVVTISFTPSEETRLALASLDSLASIAVVSRFPDFLPIMKSGVQRFAPHVSEISAATLETSGLDALIARSSVVIYASGAENIVSRLPPGLQAIEYRHAPDTADIERVIVPIIRAAEEQLQPSDKPAARAAANSEK
ncbi:GntR family transcriptional regulator [Neorhizobium sp. P12A]|jgi:DNA-binding transcriptional regulator YhcF (GntR family)|uniref:GntR family transcriptional regulator n=1 Tax=Rhizobium/Agrobacterium group TaxID=227290 RepID=UPI00104BA0DE|nr:MULTISPECIES: GntR family transcriptional regulator [Rhizobium/Agrobacterium group]KAA0695487.1 GntR family transcriptional regulator [Neorhizobium sp. P12A]TCR79035.1 GntR family transcriptional regulator [Rhizobium sp. BK376]